MISQVQPSASEDCRGDLQVLVEGCVLTCFGKALWWYMHGDRFEYQFHFTSSFDSDQHLS
jgi:hypothetical protein